MFSQGETWYFLPKNLLQYSVLAARNPRLRIVVGTEADLLCTCLWLQKEDRKGFPSYQYFALVMYNS